MAGQPSTSGITTTITPSTSSKARNILFRLFYSTSFTLVFLLLIAFICISPADALYQSYKRRRLLDLIFIAAVYVLTALIAILIYASRLYTTRSVLKDIPKTYIPLDKDELPGKKTWRLIREMGRRSAVVALMARPRARRVEVEDRGVEERVRAVLWSEERRGNSNNGEEEGDEGGVHEVLSRWGLISHAGWSSPADDELPDLQYETVVGELVDLIEAKAVSLAPIDPLATPGEDGRPVPDARIIEALARPDAMGMRAYVGRLIGMEVLEGNELTTSFLTLYERARFATRPLSEVEFKNLMRLFAEVLRSVKQVNVDLIDFDAFVGYNDDGYYDDDEEQDSKSLDRKSVLSNSRFSSASSISGSVRRHARVARRSSDGEGSVRVRLKGGGG